MFAASCSTFGDLETVSDYATVNLKELFAELFYVWQAASERADRASENVHQLRVCSRRAAAALVLFGDFLPRGKAHRLRLKLDRIRKSAGAAREGDVFLERLARREISGEDKFALNMYLQRQRAAAQQTLRCYFEECEYGEELETQATELLVGLRPRGGRGKKLDKEFDKWARRQLRRLSRRFFANATVESHDLEYLHQFRIRAKQFRYILELLQPALPVQRFQRAYSSMKKLLQRLGQINDHATAVETLSNLLEVNLAESLQDSLRHWRKDERRALRKAVAEFDAWWTSRRRRRLRRHLKRAIHWQPHLLVE